METFIRVKKAFRYAQKPDWHSEYAKPGQIAIVAIPADDVNEELAEVLPKVEILKLIYEGLDLKKITRMS